MGSWDSPYQNCRKACEGNGGLRAVRLLFVIGFQSHKSLSGENKHVIILFAVVLAVTTAHSSNEKEQADISVACEKAHSATAHPSAGYTASTGHQQLQRKTKAQMFKLSYAVSLCACMQACG